MIWQAVITGEPASKSNSRKLVHIQGRTRFIKSEKALAWTSAALWQLKTGKPAEPFTGRLGIDCRVFYATERPDLDVTLVYDALQKAGIVKNDRLFREQHNFHFIDKQNPRVEVVIFRAREARA
jgi:Holliday junction resolvase RusA-like endonuclease